MKNKPVKQFAVKFFQSIFVIGYILFEEIIWDIFAKPIFQFLKSLIVLESLRKAFVRMNRYGLLLFFLALFVVAEAMGIISGLLVVAGDVYTGILVYTLKIPVAAFTFWLFDLTKEKLFTFQWLEAIYRFIMGLIEKLINSAIHVYIRSQVLRMKQKMQALVKQYLGEEGFFASVKKHYIHFKAHNKPRFLK